MFKQLWQNQSEFEHTVGMKSLPGSGEKGQPSGWKGVLAVRPPGQRAKPHAECEVAEQQPGQAQRGLETGGVSGMAQTLPATSAGKWRAGQGWAAQAGGRASRETKEHQDSAGTALLEGEGVPRFRVTHCLEQGTLMRQGDSVDQHLQSSLFAISVMKLV